MPEESKLKPDYIFEVSWEVCNKVGGIYTVLSTRALTVKKEWGDRLIMIGPDVWKGKGENPDFIEEKNLFKLWKEHALCEGLKVKVGRWNIPGRPVAILIDFTPCFAEKNKIFEEMWVNYQLDSLTGQWDYIEPALFGHAAGKVIECFYRFHLNYTDKIVAQFHEWMTGLGILYLKSSVPQVATIFTTHATVIGRSIAGNGLPFYSKFDSYDGEQLARDFNVIAKHSLEKVSAANADCFTTVSEITKRECVKFLGKAPDVITPNGFDSSIVPDISLYEQKRTLARKKLIDVAQALFNQQFPDDSLLIIKSGRYEFKNKGLDVFIDSLAQVNKNAAVKKNIIAFIFVPAHQTGPRKELLDRLQQPDFSDFKSGETVTHYLQGAEEDPIVNQIKKNNLNTDSKDAVKIIFSPVYLDGTDGIFNTNYYDLLEGFDNAIFPSYYEPWGYTPLEAIAFHIPAITTNISGFGMAIQSLNAENGNGIYIVERGDFDYTDVVKKIASIIIAFSEKGKDEIKKLRESAFELSKMFLWKNLILHYREAYDFGLKKSMKRESLFRNKPQAEPLVSMKTVPESNPVWRNISVQIDLPDTLKALEKLSKNLWWSWNIEALELFECIDTELWGKCNHNPVLFLQELSSLKIRKLEKDKKFVEQLNAVEKNFDLYLQSKTENQKTLVAYFSMEYGLNSYLKIYSGGLGILAGDYLKEASDKKVNLVAVGLFYKHGYFRQRFSLHGEQQSDPDKLEPSTLPFHQVNDSNGNRLLINLEFPGRTVYAKCWRIDVGRVPLYLLDTDVTENNSEDKSITDQLYGGDNKNRLHQELILGLGGIRMLNALGIKPDLFHCNEGHSAFIGLERLHDLIRNENLSFETALEIVRSSTLFTTHTSVPAANDTFSEDLLRAYLSHKAQYFNISWNQLMALGRANENDHNENFSMTYLAVRLSQEVNAVSKIHKKVSCDMLNDLWNDFKAEELPVGYVTNGVHYATWTAKEFQQLYKKTFDSNFENNVSDTTRWKKIETVSDQEIWSIRKKLKGELQEKIKDKLNSDFTARHENPKKTFRIISNLNKDALLIGFARRVVTYKRSDLLFYDLQKLKEIVTNNSKPVQFLFSGKAHPNDPIGIELIRQVISITEQKEFAGKIIYLEDYNMDIARLMVQGVDVWLNTPYRQTEASGTSGMKATLNGVLNLSMLDGWWNEAFREDAGWALSADSTYENPDFQNELDAEMIYKILQNEIVPLYFERNSEGIPVNWIKKIKSAISNIAPEYTTTRMLSDYQYQYYSLLQNRFSKLKSDNYSGAKQLAEWKKKIINHWNKIETISIDIKNETAHQLSVHENLNAKIVLDLGRLSVDDIGIEILFLEKNDRNKNKVIALAQELKLVEVNEEEATYECNIPLIQSGNYEYAFRIFPKNLLLPHKQDFNLVKWI